MNFVAFPGLGITIPVDPIAFTVGPFTVRWYGIVLSLAIFTALALSLRHAPKYGIEPDRMVDMFMFALPISVIFARLFFVIVEWETFRNDLPGMFRIWEGGITIYGAVVGACIAPSSASGSGPGSTLRVCTCPSRRPLGAGGISSTRSSTARTPPCPGA
jgi:phosphatidylglycerol:prolipoprotein diacylglycerol transferase